MDSTTIVNTDKDVCPDCKGMEFIEREGGAWETCKCVKEKARLARAKKLVEASGLKGSLLEKTFENFHPKTPQQKKALEVAKKKGSFFLIGPFGTGKTHLLAASVNEAVREGKAALFFSVPWLLTRIREDLMANRPIGVLEIVCEVDYLALDDLGKEKPTETVLEKLFMILDQREVRGLRTSVTSNLNPETLAEQKLDGAIISRLKGMCEVQSLEGPDYRQTKKK